MYTAWLSITWNSNPISRKQADKPKLKNILGNKKPTLYKKMSISYRTIKSQFQRKGI